jgi:hypothetical protein
MNKNRIFVIYIFFAAAMVLISCASATTVSFLCNREDLQIYVNNQYVGTGLVRYTAPKDITTAIVECKKDGVTIYSKDFYIKGNNNALFDLKIPEYNSYSSDKQIHSK